MKKELKTITIGKKEFKMYTGSCCNKGTNKRTLYVVTSNICNAKCKFCSSRCNLAKKNEAVDIKTFENKFNVIKDNISSVAITGGEPSLYKDIIAMMQLIKRSGIQSSITTNGFKIIKFVKQLKETNSLPSFLNISRHHSNDEINDKIFGVNDMSKWEDIKEAVKVSDDETTFRINLTLNETIKSKDDIINLFNNTINAGVKNVLIRYDYNKGIDNPFNVMLNDILGLEYKCTKCDIKCECRDYIYRYNDKELDVEVRLVDMNKESKIENDGDFIRNFIYNEHDELKGGWSDESITLL